MNRAPLEQRLICTFEAAEFARLANWCCDSSSLATAFDDRCLFCADANRLLLRSSRDSNQARLRFVRAKQSREIANSFDTFCALFSRAELICQPFACSALFGCFVAAKDSPQSQSRLLRVEFAFLRQQLNRARSQVETLTTISNSNQSSNP